MKPPPLKYVERLYKYKVAERFTIQTNVFGHHVVCGFYMLTPNGMLTVFEGYCWDGGSGPAVDTPAMIAASLPHDVFFQMMREGQIPTDEFKTANTELERIYKLYAAEVLKTKPAWERWLLAPLAKLRAKWVYEGVKDFGRQYARPQVEVVISIP